LLNKGMSDDSAEGLITGQISEAVWTVSKTGKPIASVVMETEDADALEGHAEEEARRMGIQVVRIHQSDDPEVVPEVMVFYREETMLDVFKFLESDVALNTIPADIHDALLGLLYGYRTDAIHSFVEGLRESLGPDASLPLGIDLEGEPT